jgi:hypothetical protein
MECTSLEVSSLAARVVSLEWPACLWQFRVNYRIISRLERLTPPSFRQTCLYSHCTAHCLLLIGGIPGRGGVIGFSQGVGLHPSPFLSATPLPLPSPPCFLCPLALWLCPPTLSLVASLAQVRPAGLMPRRRGLASSSSFNPGGRGGQ